MIELFSIEFWIVTLFIINFIFVIFLLFFVKKVNRLNLNLPSNLTTSSNCRETDQTKCKENIEYGVESSEHLTKSSGDIIEMLEPLVQESQNSALRFDKQIKEKKRLIKELNDALDSRIISINLLLSRADALQKKMEERQKQPDLNFSSVAVIDQQNKIIEMYNQNIDIDSIAQRLSIPKGEVQLVIDLKKRFIAMEKNGR
jgi:hypothetical protein